MTGDRTDTTSTRTSTRTGARREADRPEPHDDEQLSLPARLVAWFRDVAWEFDDREPSIRAVELHQRVRIVSWVLLAFILWRLGVLILRIVADVQPMPEFALQADEDGIRTALLYVVGGVILVPAGLFLLWVIVKWMWNLSLDLIRERLARVIRPIAWPIVGVFWLQVLFLLRRELAGVFWYAYYWSRHTLELANQFNLG